MANKNTELLLTERITLVSLFPEVLKLHLPEYLMLMISTHPPMQPGKREKSSLPQFTQQLYSGARKQATKVLDYRPYQSCTISCIRM